MKLIKRIYDNLTELTQGLIVGGVLAGIAFLFFQMYPTYILYACLIILIIQQVLSFFLPKYNKCRKCKKGNMVVSVTPKVGFGQKHIFKSFCPVCGHIIKREV